MLRGLARPMVGMSRLLERAATAAYGMLRRWARANPMDDALAAAAAVPTCNYWQTALQFPDPKAQTTPHLASQHGAK